VVRWASTASRGPTSSASSPAPTASVSHPPRPPATGDGDREEPGERADRELIELLNELRVALPGVQVLFAFLLGIPFTQRFGELDAADRRIFFGAVVATAAATICLMAPTAHHRMRFRSGVKEQLLNVANWLAIVGMVLLACAITAVTYVIANEMYPGAVSGVVAAGLAAGFTVVWFVVPQFYRRAPTPPHHGQGEQGGPRRP
jgi:MFS family permease